MKQLKSDSSSSYNTCHIVLDHVEKYMCLLMREMMSGRGDKWSVTDIEALVIDYRKVLSRYHVLLKISTRSARTMSVITSVEVLVQWVGFCLVHHAVKQFSTLVADYSVPLNPLEMPDLAFSDKLHVDIWLLVCSYLRHERAQSHTIFSFRGNDNTLQLAHNYAKSDPVMCSVFEMEKINAEKNVKEHWKEVELKKAEAAIYRNQIIDQEAEVRQLLEDEAKEPKGYRYLTSASAQKNLDSTRKYLHAALSPPPPVVQALPSDEKGAFIWIFFLYMPVPLQVLGRMSFMCQQARIPKPWKLKALGLTVTQRQLVRGHYSKYSRISSDVASYSADYVFLHTSINIPSKIGSSSVDNMSTKDNGIFHPELGDTAMGWKGGKCSVDAKGSQLFDPFRQISADKTNDYFTERLPLQYASLQWSLPQHTAQPLTRGNEGLARQNFKSTRLLKDEYLCFTNLRAFSRIQFRNLCESLHSKRLPLDHDAVHALIKQTLYHIGPTGQDITRNDMALVWRMESDFDDVLNVLTEELNRLQVELSAKPRDYYCTLLLVEVAAYVSQWAPQCRNVCRAFTTSVLTWAADICSRIDRNEVAVEYMAAMRSKECVYYMIGIIALGIGSTGLTEGDTKELLCMNALLKHRQMFEEGSDDEVLSHSLSIICDSIMVSRWESMSCNVSFQMLTECVQGVLACNVPNDLEWENDLGTACWHATSADNHLYSINVISGVVLFDGNTPNRLPHVITSLPLYRRVFKEFNFESVLSGSGIISTLRLICGRKYNFYLGGNLKGDRRFLVEEVSSECSFTLLDSSKCTSWGGLLPIRLKELYTHWYCAELDVVVFRPCDENAQENFSSRGPEFIVMGANGGWPCLYAIPAHLMSKYSSIQTDLCETLERDLDELVLLQQCQLLSVLGKFEDPAFIHAYHAFSEKNTVSSSQARRLTKMVLPRYGLEFECTDSGVFSLNFSGFSLVYEQQYTDTLPTFTNYLILRDAHHVEYVIVPVGNVLKTEYNVYIEPNNDCGAVMEYYTFTVHPRFRYFMSTDNIGRLFLASLYAATSTYLPELRSYMTGEQRAMELIRESWSNRPITAEEYNILQQILGFSFRVPALRLLCIEYIRNSERMSVLFTSTDKFVPSCLDTLSNDETYHYAATEYKGGKNRNVKSKLTSGEEMTMFGGYANPRPSPYQWTIPGQYGVGEIAFPLNEEKYVHFISTVNNEIAAMVSTVSRSISSDEKFPLGSSYGTGSDCDRYKRISPQLEAKLIGELRESWNDYHTLEDTSLLGGRNNDSLVSFLEDARAARKTIEESILGNFNWKYKSTVCSKTDLACYNMLRYGIHCPPFSCRDLLNVLASRSSHMEILQFNPLLSRHSCRQIWRAGLLWAQLCVLEDKLYRLIGFRSNAMAFVQETLVVRQWDVTEYPGWLVYEVEQCVQIRNNQYTVAKEMINNPGAIVQLNMGEGKTRIILPMLIIHYIYGDSKKQELLPRIHFLAQLINEGHDHLQNTMCSSIFQIKFILMPFHRDVCLTCNILKVMKMFARLGQSEGGVFLTTPEQRLSLQLKLHELRMVDGSEEICDNMVSYMESVLFAEILDESDEILRHNSQLIYTASESRKLPDGPARWTATEALLWALNSDPEVLSVLHRYPQSFVYISSNDDAITHPGSFRQIRLIPGVHLSKNISSLYNALAISVTRSPPYMMRWLRRLHGRTKDEVINFLTNEAIECSSEVLNICTPEEMSHLLGLRGMLAFGMLAHCLSRRHRVDYGISRPHILEKRVAVPFRANDVPTLRTEFENEDKTICLTVLSYYYDGLNPVELRAMFVTLLSCPPKVQVKKFSEMYALCAATIISDQHNSKLDELCKIDLSNNEQFVLLVKYFSCNIHAINMWLGMCLFEEEMLTFPSQMRKTAWDLCGDKNAYVVGFSGTNDSKDLLPLQVHQHHVGNKHISSTNGKMLALLLRSEEYVSVPTDGEEPVWQLLLELCMEKRTHALCDAGALLAGVSPSDATVFLLNHVSFNQRGVVYFETGADRHKGWYVRDKKGRIWPKGRSPIKERDAFVIFDEHHCRGVDMKLKDDAIAVLTLGPSITKDTLMQAAARMRGLEKQQSLILAGAADVTSKIVASRRCNISTVAPHISTRAGCEEPTRQVITVTPNTEDCLHWVIQNTILAVQRGLSQWANQGVHHCATISRPLDVVFPVKAALTDLYFAPKKPRSLMELHCESRDETLLRCHMHADDQMSCIYNERRLAISDEVVKILIEIDRRVSESGIIQSNDNEANFDTECERELEMEDEEEKEVEIEVQRMEPAAHRPWDYAQLLTASMPVQLAGADVLNISEVLPRHISSDIGVSHVLWRDLYITNNALNPVIPYGIGLERDKVTLNQYLRPVNFVLTFKQFPYPILIISDAEAQDICVQLLCRPDKIDGFIMSNLAYLKQLFFDECDTKTAVKLSSPCIPHPQGIIPALTSAQIFSGDTTFIKNAPLQDILPTKIAKKAAMGIVSCRGFEKNIEQSDLETYDD